MFCSPIKLIKSQLLKVKLNNNYIKNNEKFSQNILYALREVAEEKEQSKTQEDGYQILEQKNKNDGSIELVLTKWEN